MSPQDTFSFFPYEDQFIKCQFPYQMHGLSVYATMSIRKSKDFRTEELRRLLRRSTRHTFSLG